MTLAAVIQRLSRHEAVDGLLLIGSTGKQARTPVSDYDLVVVLSRMPVPLHVGLTSIDQQLTDLVFVKTAIVETILADDRQVDAEVWQGRLIRWLQAGEIVFDRSGALAAAQQKARTADLLRPVSEGAIHSAWFSTYYDLAQTQRLVASSDPVHLMTVDLRLLFSLYQLWPRYFLVRGLLWEGDKAAIRYLDRHDPAYLALFKRCLAEPDRGRKVDLYHQLVDRTMAPAGDRFMDGETIFQFEGGTDVQQGMIETALSFWEGLLEE